MSRTDSKLRVKMIREERAKKRSLLQSASARSGLSAPTIVDTIPGDPDGLLPVEALVNGIKITVPDWKVNNPPPFNSERLVVEWKFENESDENYKALLTKAFITPIDDPFPLELTIAKQDVDGREGLFSFRYAVQIWSDTSLVPSDPVKITIDRTPPWGTEQPPAIVASTTPITDDSLAANGGGVNITIPDFVDTKKEFTHVLVGWLKWPPEPENPFTPNINQLLPSNQTVKILSADVQELGSGDHYVVYMLRDKAGNYSRVSKARTMAVALGPLPIDLKSPIVPLASDGKIDLMDAYAGVDVEIPLYKNFLPGDTVVVQWGTSYLYPMQLGEVPTDPLVIPVSWSYLDKEYTVATGAQVTPVTYSVFRGTTPFLLHPDNAIEVEVDFSTTGPDNPDHPDPVNASLGLITIVGNSGTPNHLSQADNGFSAAATIPLYAPLTPGDVITVYWNGVAISDSHTVSDSEQDDFTFTVTWPEILAGKPGTAVPVHYTLSNPAFINDQTSWTTNVHVEAVPIILEAAQYVDFSTLSGGQKILNCTALRKIETDIGYRVHIPASEYLVVGSTMSIAWTLKNSDLTPVPDSEKLDNIIITTGNVIDGINWFVTPYSDHVLPAYEKSTDGWAIASVSYTLVINGASVSSAIESINVGIGNVAPGFETCDLNIVVVAP